MLYGVGTDTILRTSHTHQYDLTVLFLESGSYAKYVDMTWVELHAKSKNSTQIYF